MKSPKLICSFSAVVLGLGAMAACDETLPPELTVAAPVARLETRPANLTCVAPAPPSGRVKLVPAFKGLYRPIVMVDRPSLPFVYVAEMPGRVRTVDRATGAIATALDLVGRVGTSAEQGLVGMVMHPSKPYVYVVVERDADATSLKDLPSRAEILRFETKDGGRTFDPSSEMLVLRIDRAFPIHYPGTLEFGPDGFLYIGAGDGGRAVPAYPTDQLPGSVLRIDVDGGTPYAIPPDNPYAKGGGRPEIFAGGFRNPWRFTFDRGTGEIWLADVGENEFEEINKVERGKNYGWPLFEGPACRAKGGCDGATGLTPPLFYYRHSEGASITGGYVYRGKAMPDLVGKYIFGDFATGRIYALEGAAPDYRTLYLNEGGPFASLSSFGQDGDGELYALDWTSGTIYRLTPGEPSAKPAFADRLSETGCVNRAAPREPAPGLVPYGVNVELWSDGAAKERFVAIPDGSKIHVEDDGDMTLPEGSVLVKTFTLADKRIETRLLYRYRGGEWAGATYEWNDAQTDALRLDTGKEKVLSNGQTWAFPSTVQCFVCHTQITGRSLGFETMQLNRDFAYAAGQSTNQLTTLADIGYIDRRPDLMVAPRLPELRGPEPAEDRARAYLHANCSMCHRPGAGTTSGMDLRYGQPRSAIAGCTPSSYPGTEVVQVLEPGDPQASALFRRLTTRDTYQMPPLATHKVDDVAASVVESWIRDLKTCE